MEDRQYIETALSLNDGTFSYEGKCGRCEAIAHFSRILFVQRSRFEVISVICNNCESKISVVQTSSQEGLYLVTGPMPDLDFMKELMRI